MYSEVFEEEGQQAYIARDNSDAESVQSSCHSPELQAEPSANFHMKASGGSLSRQLVHAATSRLH